MDPLAVGGLVALCTVIVLFSGVSVATVMAPSSPVYTLVFGIVDS